MESLEKSGKHVIATAVRDLETNLEVESHLSENNRAKKKTMFFVMFYLFDHRVQTSTQLHYHSLSS